jgi:hypothetical protein
VAKKNAGVGRDRLVAWSLRGCEVVIEGAKPKSLTADFGKAGELGNPGQARHGWGYLNFLPDLVQAGNTGPQRIPSNKNDGCLVLTQGHLSCMKPDPVVNYLFTARDGDPTSPIPLEVEGEPMDHFKFAYQALYELSGRATGQTVTVTFRGAKNQSVHFNPGSQLSICHQPVKAMAMTMARNYKRQDHFRSFYPLIRHNRLLDLWSAKPATGRRPSTLSIDDPDHCIMALVRRE